MVSHGGVLVWWVLLSHIVTDSALSTDGEAGGGVCAEQTNKHLRCGNRKGLLGRNDQTHHRNVWTPTVGQANLSSVICTYIFP